MSEERRRGWIGAAGRQYEFDDLRLKGYGTNPPNDPEWQKENPGMGTIPLEGAVLDPGPRLDQPKDDS